MKASQHMIPRLRIGKDLHLRPKFTRLLRNDRTNAVYGRFVMGWGLCLHEELEERSCVQDALL
jgi:hypothetical protein